jgi:hypothetical protein
MFKIVFYLLNLILFSCFNSFAQDATSIVKKADELMRAKSSYTELTMNIVKPGWSREMGMKVWALEPDYSMIYITEPARDNGTLELATICTKSNKDSTFYDAAKLDGL